ncbi:MAG: cytochrome c [Gemmatimonadota bacterium]|nr:cytochrome c [Gemmatimonadota bacterium]
MRPRLIVAAAACVASGALGIAHAQAGRSRGSAARPAADGLPAVSPTNEDLQPTQLPPLPASVTVEDIVDGDRIFHSVGGCFACHGAEAAGLPAAGSAITTGLAYVPVDVGAIATLVTQGLPDPMTRSPIGMPARGARGNLTAVEITHVAEYVWAISQVRGEPWSGGHASHFHLVPPGSTSGTASPDRPAPRHP